MGRQTERTRAAIISTFSEMVFTTHYENIKMSDIARRANVGRSTIYQHYRDKDAVLLDSMDWILVGLSACVNSNVPNEEIVYLLQHVWEHRDRARKLFFGTTGQRLERALSTKVASQIALTVKDSDWLISPVFVANQIAAALFSILRSWVIADASASAEQLAQHLHNSANALNHVALGKTIYSHEH
ncbi:MAG: hypothetical protein COA62_07290 [Rhodobiaceae bacterium]|nr:MAG: hypothetical protein COA62_07290 [Rhodobiaceae bacterium]